MNLNAVEIDVDAYRDSKVSVIARTAATNPVWTAVDGGPIQPLAPLYYLRALTAGVELRAPLKIEVTATDEGMVETYAPALRLTGVGNSVDRAVGDLIDTTLGLWEEFSRTPPDRLHPSAATVLARLRGIIGG